MREWTPKVGDRVKLKPTHDDASSVSEGTIGYVFKRWNDQSTPNSVVEVNWDDGGVDKWHISELELLTDQPREP